MFDSLVRGTRGNRHRVVVELLSIRQRRTRRAGCIGRHGPVKGEFQVLGRSTKKPDHFIQKCY